MLFVAMFLICGCETDPVPTKITITPADVLMHDNESVEFTASGGFDYQWSLEKDKYEYGVLSSRTGSKVTYTSLYSGTTVVYQTLYVTATIPGSSGGSGSNGGSGGGHGGIGGASAPAAGGIAYGSATMPTTPGSGGGGTYDNVGGHGGGVVFIQTTNITVNGSILARGGSGATYNGGGAGGSILILCKKFSGTNGTISVAGGARGTGYPTLLGGGGGGRIALYYTELGGTPTVTFSAAGGTTSSNNPVCGMGTIYLSNTNLLRQPLQYFQGGRIIVPGFTNWTCSSLVVSGQVGFADAPFKLTVNNNLTIGNNGWLIIGGKPLSMRNSVGYSDSGTNALIRIGGDLVMNGAWWIGSKRPIGGNYRRKIDNNQRRIFYCL